MSTLEIRDLHVSVEVAAGSAGAAGGAGVQREILRGVNLTVAAGETHAIMGPNGSGKSTLAYVLAGKADYEPTAGEVLLDGKNLFDMGPDARAAA